MSKQNLIKFLTSENVSVNDVSFTVIKPVESFGGCDTGQEISRVSYPVEIEFNLKCIQTDVVVENV